MRVTAYYLTMGLEKGGRRGEEGENENKFDFFCI
jgi:hypothetical protein